MKRTVTILMLLVGLKASAWDFGARAGLSIGGNAPLSIPVEIREISRFAPGFQADVQLFAQHGFSGQWAFRFGLGYSMHGMETSAMTKNYGMSIAGDDGSSLSGYWTGSVDTHSQNHLLTVPVNAVYSFSPSFRILAGFSATYLLSGDFSGSVTDGYLREGAPTGAKIVFNADSTAPYDFSDKLSKWGASVHAGAEYSISSRFALFAELTCGLNDMFQHDFETITFRMQPIFFTIGCTIGTDR